MAQALRFSYANGHNIAWLTCHRVAVRTGSDNEGEGSLSPSTIQIFVMNYTNTSTLLYDATERFVVTRSWFQSCLGLRYSFDHVTSKNTCSYQPCQGPWQDVANCFSNSSSCIFHIVPKQCTCFSSSLPCTITLSLMLLVKRCLLKFYLWFKAVYVLGRRLLLALTNKLPFPSEHTF